MRNILVKNIQNCTIAFFVKVIFGNFNTSVLHSKCVHTFEQVNPARDTTLQNS